MSIAIWLIITLPGLLIWVTIWLLPWRPWRTHPRLESQTEARSNRLADITVLIPARNEADLIDATLQSVFAQGTELHTIVIDDSSDDGTAAIARRRGAQVLSAPPAPAGWSGKLWALEHGLATVDTPLVLLLDADISLSAGIVSRLRQHFYANKLTLASLFVTLRMRSFWEQLLMPAFGYFFRLLYPFARSNTANTRTAAAAGGCILVDTAALRHIGGFASFHDTLIDDCTLARKIKAGGGTIWLGLTRAANSERPYPTLGSVWDLVARCAFTQLNYSGLQLLLCSVLIVLAFCMPVAGLFAPQPVIKLISLGTLAAMMTSYLPTLRYYQRNGIWTLSLPFVGLLYLGMTWSSALRYWRGTRSRWKGRDYRV